MLFLLFQFIEEKVTYFGIQMMTGVATSYMVVFIGIYLSIELYPASIKAAEYCNVLR